MRSKTSCLFMLVVHACLWQPQALAHVSADILEAVIQVESTGNPWAESRDGCRGLGQIKKETWYWVCDKMNVRWGFDQAFDPVKNRRVTEYYLNWLAGYLKSHGHYSMELLFASYNAGPGVVRRMGWQVPPFRETRQYIRKIQKILDEQKE